MSSVERGAGHGATLEVVFENPRFRVYRRRTPT